MNTNITICPGCGVHIQGSNLSINKERNASEACVELYHQLLFYTLSLHDTYFLHQHVVDIYAVQHTDKSTKPITTVFGLIGLYLMLECGYTGKQVQLAHIALAKKKKQWPHFPVPEQKASITILQVIQTPDDQKKEIIFQWAHAVWNIWHEEHITIKNLITTNLSNNEQEDILHSPIA